ncbi:hypothetical protein TrLO_g3864 [Triparma laevis f. longispina]|uniref:Uncharacterized protein n=1 Tax=Triparma laevis f. longispina TaxID=1714387 RepID=A0A9W7EAV0_9STRA|nr:hypothetical protein TrLO_g3864 [Triparma laevis f. longispina]
MEAARERLSSVINDLNNEKEDPKKKLKKIGAVNADTFAVNGKHGPNYSMIYDRNTKTIHLEIQKDPDKVLESMIEGWTATGDKFIQKVLKETTEDNKTIVHWTIVDQNKGTSLSLLLWMKVERNVNGEIRIAVESTDEEDLDTACLPVPKPTTAKAFRLLLNGGSITLKPLSLGRPSFTVTAQADLREEEQFDDVDVSPGRGTVLGTDLIKTVKAGFKREILGNVVGQFYKRFEKEAAIDERRKKDLIENIDNATALTEAERKLIAGSMNLVEEVSSKAKRIAGTANESVEKFMYHSEEGGAALAMTVAKVDLSAVSLFAQLWLLDTYAEKFTLKDRAIMETWNDLDGTRGLQYTTAFGLPGGFQDRLFETWEVTTDREGWSTFIIAWVPLETYEGTNHEVAGAENMVKATTIGVFIIKLTEKSCEWTRAQQADLKFSSSMPVSALNFFDNSLEIDAGRRAEIVKKIKREEEAGGGGSFSAV